MQNNSNDKILRDYVMKNDKKSEIFHSSGYAEAQNGSSIGTASTGLSMAERKALEKKRQFVAKYNTSEMLSETFSNRKMAKKFDPNVNKTGSSSFNNSSAGIHSNTDGDASGNVRTSYGRSEDTRGIGGTSSAKGIGEAGGYTPFKTGGTPSGTKPSGISPSIRPKF